MVKFIKNSYLETVCRIKNFKDDPIGSLNYLINVVVFLMAIIGGIVSYIVFITNGVYAEHIEIFKENGIGGMSEAFTFGTIACFTKGIPGIIAICLIITNIILSTIAYIKVSGIFKKVAIIIDLSIFTLSGAFLVFFDAVGKGLFGTDFNSDNIFIQLFNKINNMETFVLVLMGIFAGSALLLIVLLIITHESRGMFYNTFLNSILYFAAAPLLVLFLENIIPLVSSALYVALFCVILFVIIKVILSSGAGGDSASSSNGGFSGSSKSSGSTGAPKPATPKPKDRVVTEKDRAYVPKGLKVVRVKGLMHDYVATENFVGVTYELCSVEALEKDKFHIFETESGREITKYEIPWQK